MIEYRVHKKLLGSTCFARTGRVVLGKATQSQLRQLAKDNPNYVYDPKNPDRDSIMTAVEVNRRKKKKANE